MSVQNITPATAALRPVKLSIIDYHTSEFLIVQGRSSKEYRFDYSREHQALVYETNCQDDVNDLMRSNGLYGFFCVSVVVEKEPAATITPPADIEPASETVSASPAIPSQAPESKPAKRPYVRKAKQPTEG